MLKRLFWLQELTDVVEILIELLGGFFEPLRQISEHCDVIVRMHDFSSFYFFRTLNPTCRSAFIAE